MDFLFDLSKIKKIHQSTALFIKDNPLMKTFKLIIVLFFIFSPKVFSQNPIIENVNICTTPGSSSNIEVLNPVMGSSYSWEIKTPSQQNWTPITVQNAGAEYEDYTTSVLTINKTSILPVSSTKYRVIASNGSGSLISNEVVLTVNPLSIATKTIFGASPVCIEGNKLLNCSTDYVGDIQWQLSTISNSTGFEDINNENGITYQATNIQDSAWYRVVNTSGACPPAFSNAVEIVVNSKPVPGNIEGGDIDVCKIGNVTDLYLYNSIGSIVWQKSSNIEGPFSNISGATSFTYRASLLSSTTYFRVAVSNGVCPTEYSEPIYINVDAESKATSITGILQVCAGNNITLNYGSGSIGNIQWQTSTTSGLSDFIDETDKTGLTFSINNIEDTTWFRVVNTNGECGPAYSPVFQVVVNQQPESGTLDIDDITVCKTSNSTRINLYDSLGSIQWQRAPDFSGSPGTFVNISSGGTRNFYIASSLTETSYFRATISSGVCPPILTGTVKINVAEPAVVKSISGASPVCFGGSKVLSYEAGSLGTIQWQSSTSSSSDGFIDIGGEDTETLTSFDLQETTWFRVSNTTNEVCPTLYSPAVRVLVNSLPVAGSIINGNELATNDSNSTELILINYEGSIQWQKSNSIGEDFVDIPNATSFKLETADLKDANFFRTVVSSGNCSKVQSEPYKIKLNSDFNVTLFPNPFNEEFNINLKSLSTEPIELETYDLLGRKINSQIIKPTEINSKRNGNDFLPGIYTLFIKQGKQNKSIKIIKK